MNIKYAILFRYCNLFILKPSSKTPLRTADVNNPAMRYVAILHEIGIKKANNDKKIYSTN